jgi:hypothetical protein
MMIPGGVYVCLATELAGSDAWTDRRVSVQVNYHISARHHKSRF